MGNKIGPLLLILTGCLLLAWPALAMPPGPPAAKVMDQPRYAHASWGYYVADLKTGQTLAALNPEQWFVPGSTTKLFSCAAILELLGPDYHFHTPVYAYGDVKSGVLNGDLILVASGDLNMGGRIGPGGKLDYPLPDHTVGGTFPFTPHKGNPLAALEDLARQVKAAGVDHISGEVLIDNRLFPLTLSPDEEFWLSPIMINDNYVDITLMPGKPGSKPKLAWRPRTAAIQVTNQVKTGPKGSEPQVEVVWAPFNEIVIKGLIPANGKPVNVAGQTDEPARFARALFIKALRKAGVEVAADPAGENPVERLPGKQWYKEMAELGQYDSPPLKSNIEMILKISHNLHALTLPMLIAAHTSGETYDQAMASEAALLGKTGFDINTVCLVDGAGGPVGNRISPKAAAELLRAAAKRPWFDVYEKCLPILGVDGTLAHSVPDASPAKGKAQAKTGTIMLGDPLNDRVNLAAKAMAGTMTTKSGRRVAFAIYVNNSPMKEPKELDAIGKDLGAVAEALYETY